MLFFYAYSFAIRIHPFIQHMEITMNPFGKHLRFLQRRMLVLVFVLLTCFLKPSEAFLQDNSVAVAVPVAVPVADPATQHSFGKNPIRACGAPPWQPSRSRSSVRFSSMARCMFMARSRSRPLLLPLAAAGGTPEFSVVQQDDDSGRNDGDDGGHDGDGYVSKPLPDSFALGQGQKDNDDTKGRKAESKATSKAETAASVPKEKTVVTRRAPIRRQRPAAAPTAAFASTTSSWMERNAEFSQTSSSAPAAAAAEFSTPSFSAAADTRKESYNYEQKTGDRPPPRRRAGGPPPHPPLSPRQQRQQQQSSTRGRQPFSPSKDNASSLSPNDSSWRDDFRGSRVFVQGLPPHVTWQNLKDHFRVAGEVVFASVSIDPGTGASKGHGLVQFATVAQAIAAPTVMRDHPLEGVFTLDVRPDRQEASASSSFSSSSPRKRRHRDRGSGSDRVDDANDTQQPRNFRGNSDWECADEGSADARLDEQDAMAVQSMIRARDEARRRKQYQASDMMRQELKDRYGVHIDDRLKMWWTSTDAWSSSQPVPQRIQDIKGPGRWGTPSTPWRQIPTSPEHDALVDPDRVADLLRRRDAARRDRNFDLADTLLEEVRTSPDDPSGDIYLRIHDESRTWRIWTPAPPPPQQHAPFGQERRNRRDQRVHDGWDQEEDNNGWEDDDASRPAATNNIAAQCLALIQKHAPHRLGEMKVVLKQFEGRQEEVLAKLQQRYEA